MKRYSGTFTCRKRGNTCCQWNKMAGIAQNYWKTVKILDSQYEEIARKGFLMFSNRKDLACLALGALLAGMGCASRTYTIKTEPSGADVSLNGKNIGKTPYTFTTESISRESDNIILLTKESMAPVYTVIPAGMGPILSGEASFTLTQKESETQKVNRFAGLLWKAQRLSGQGNYLEASRLADQLLSEDSDLAAAHLLKASILFLSKNVPQAMDEWKKTLQIDPTNEEATRALRLMKNLGEGTAP